MVSMTEPKKRQASGSAIQRPPPQARRAAAWSTERLAGVRYAPGVFMSA